MTKRDITMDEIVEGMAIGIYHARNGNGAMHWARRSNSYKQPYLGDGRASLSHLLTTLNITPEQLIALVNKKAVVVSVDRGHPDKGLKEPVRSFDDTPSAYEIIEKEFFSDAALKARP